MSTLFDKVWDSHVVRQIEDGPDVFFIDRHFIHEVTSPVAFVGLKSREIGVFQGSWMLSWGTSRCCIGSAPGFYAA